MNIAQSAAQTLGVPRHAAFVRVTHWISALSFIVLLLSGVAMHTCVAS